MTRINLNDIRETLPKGSKVELTKYNGRTKGQGSTCFECSITGKSLSEKDFDACKQKQRDILGKTLLEFYTEETGRHWFIYLKSGPIEFINI